MFAEFSLVICLVSMRLLVIRCCLSSCALLCSLLVVGRVSIPSTWGLQECVQLVHLDLTHNRVKVVEGLESLTQLRTLLLGKNNINTLDSIRSLSFNTYELR